MRLWVLPAQVWLPLLLAALAPLVLAGLVALPLSRGRARGIATVLTLRSVLLLGFGFATLVAVATVSVVRAGLRELHERYAPQVRALADDLAHNPLGPVSGSAQLRLTLFRAKDANVAFVVAGGDGCAWSCIATNARPPASGAALTARLRAAWPVHPDDRNTIGFGNQAYLLVSSPILDATGAPVPHNVTVVAAIDATYIVGQAAWTAWILLGISYVLLVLVASTTWRRLAMYIKRTLDEQQSSDERHRRLVELSPDAIFICSSIGIRFANSAGVALAGARHRRELIGSPIEHYLDLSGASVNATHDRIGSTLRPAKWKRRDGTVLHVQVAEIADSSNDDKVRQFVIRDITNQQMREADLTHRAEHDALTGLGNRTRFLARLTELMRSHDTRRTGEVREAAVLFIDLDDFKPVNDAFGHAAGDAVLVAVADRLRHATRATDVVARLGGDEFAVLLEVRDRDELATVAQRILRSLGKPVHFNGKDLTVGASIGTASARPDRSRAIALVPDDSAGRARDLLAAADAAMYAAKSAGGDGVCDNTDNEQSTHETPAVSFPAVA